VTDDQGATDGIGSRYFEIRNEGDSAAVLWALDHLEESTSLGLHMRKVHKGYRQQENPVRQNVAMEPERKGEVEQPREIILEQLERLEVHFASEAGLEYVGWGRDKSKPLPVGSTLDKKNGSSFLLGSRSRISRAF